jgi:hypothetical protein
MTMILPPGADMSLRYAAFALVLSIPLFGIGCLNDCQRLCNEMAAYWDECPNVTFGDSEAADCRESFRDDELSAQYEGACGALMRNAEDADGNVSTFLRVEYTCEDMASGPGGAFGGDE